jgi:predicted outer membrane protein
MKYAALGTFGSLLVMSAAAHGQTAPPAWPPELEQAQREALDVAAPTLVRVHLATGLGASLGKLAERRGTAPEVRRLGRLVAADLARAGEALEKYTATRHQLGLHRITRIVDHTQALRRHVTEVRDQLAALQGAAFDQRFLEAMSRMPGEMLELLGEGWQAAPDPRLRAELERTAALMQQHRELADGLLARPRPRG